MDTRSYLPVQPGVGMEENFLSLDDILLSHERLPVRTECTFPRLGFLDKSSDSQDIPEGTKMELPLWLSKGLYEKKRRVLSVELPKVYREGWRTVFNADPNVVDLHKMGPYYYCLGSQMLHFDSPENPEIAQTLLQWTAALEADLQFSPDSLPDQKTVLLPFHRSTQSFGYYSCLLNICLQSCISSRCPEMGSETFIGRFRRNMDSSQNAYNEDTSALVERLDCLERALFTSGQSGLIGFQSWEKGQASQLTASSLVLNYRKRKITDVQP